MASAYGWRKKWILEEVYFDELFEYIDRIRKRRVNEYRILLAISQNPHMSEAEDRSKLWEIFDSLESDEEIVESEPSLDRGGFEMMKMSMSNNPRIIIK